MQRCRQCDPQGSEEASQKANSSLDRIINQSVRVLTDRLFEHIRVSNAFVSHSFSPTHPKGCMTATVQQAFPFPLQPFFDKLVKRKWLNNTDAFEAIEASIKQHFKKFKRMDCPPYQV